MDGGMMIMYFHARVREHILFRDWYTRTAGGRRRARRRLRVSQIVELAISCVAVALIGVLLEAFKALRLYVHRREDEAAVGSLDGDVGCCSFQLWHAPPAATAAYGATSPPLAASPDAICECAPVVLRPSRRRSGRGLRGARATRRIAVAYATVTIRRKASSIFCRPSPPILP